MKDWCHTNDILQVYSWGCQVVQVMFHALVTSSMTSPRHKVGKILKLIYIRQYFSYRVDQKLKISYMLMAIWLVYSTNGITSGKKVCRDLKMAAILKIFKYERQLHFYLIYENIVPNYAKKVFFMVMTSSMTSHGGLKIGPLYSCLGEARSGSKWKGHVSSIHANIVMVFLGYTCMKKISIYNTVPRSGAAQRSTSQVYCVTLALKRP